jgi:hypothetical protein
MKKRKYEKIKLNGKVGLVNKNDKIIVKPKYYNVHSLFINGLTFIVIKENNSHKWV